MALVTTVDMLTKAQTGRYAVGAFNAENLEMVQAIVSAAEEKHSPVIVQFTPGSLSYASPGIYYAIVASVSQTAAVPVAIHLDHGDSFDAAVHALYAGYTSIMIDGSKESFEDNVALSRSVVRVCGACGIPVEAELGKVGGKEDNTVNNSVGAGYTDPEEASLFVQQTGVSSLAIGIGTAHGVYKEKPNIKTELAAQVRAKVSVPLVMHGTSGVPDDVVKACVENGICKVNYATELRIAYTKASAQYLSAHPDTIDPKKFGAAARDAVRAAVSAKIDVCGSANRA
ncbi:fructose-bisphosphate aldolase [Clostridia bacterium]|nr:fructose-bisphosphate aldolase [Clostridia bacterium]